MKKEFYVYLYIFALIGVSIFLSAKNGPAKSLSWDAMGYNAYYSMLFHDADKIDYFNEINNEYKNCDALYQFHQTDSTFYTRYTMGWAITYSPFMGLAHLYAINSDNKADFYSKPYQIAAYIGTFFFLLVAWMLTWKTIRHYFDFKTSLVALIITSLGTSYFYYSFFGMGMNHHVQFFLVSLLMYLSVRYVHNPNRKHLIFMGITLALIGLVRIPDLLFSLFPLLLFIRHKLLWSLFSRQQILYTGGSLLLLIVLMSLQLIYWKVFAGSYFLNSYDSNPGEGLELSSLTIFSFLFSYRSGLIPYFPVYLIAITGMVVLFKYEKRIALTGSLTLLIFLYVVGSWSAFWYAPRAVLEALPIFVFGIAAWVKLLRKSALIILLAFCCVAFNLFKTWQTSSYVVIPTRMTKDAYYAAFWKTNPLTGSDTLFYRPHEVHFNQLEMKKWKKVISQPIIKR